MCSSDVFISKSFGPGAMYYNLAKHTICFMLSESNTNLNLMEMKRIYEYS